MAHTASGNHRQYTTTIHFETFYFVVLPATVVVWCSNIPDSGSYIKPSTGSGGRDQNFVPKVMPCNDIKDVIGEGPNVMKK